jgi:hypothetical protein
MGAEGGGGQVEGSGEVADSGYSDEEAGRWRDEEDEEEE